MRTQALGKLAGAFVFGEKDAERTQNTARRNDEGHLPLRVA